jgi:phosphatidylserine decarboxylase
VTLRATLHRIVASEDLNFLLTNRIPRVAFTRAMGRISKLTNPIVARPSQNSRQSACDVDLSDADAPRYPSLHDAFIRRLRPGARKIDTAPDIVVSPCDAIVGAHGAICDGQLHQIKGFPYMLADLLGDEADSAPFRNGSFVTLRLTAGMYHRFHAPHDLIVERVRYISGDTWNVNPIALARIERLFCKNERAPISVRLTTGGLPLMLVPGCGPAELVSTGWPPPLPKARRWAGSSMDRPSCCSPRRAWRCVRRLRKVGQSAWVRRC